MNKFQELIIKQNQKVRSKRLQILVLYAQFLFTFACLLNAMSILERKNNTNKLKFEFIYYVTLPSFAEFLNISQIVIQTITIFFSLMCIIIIIFEDNLKGMAKLAEIIWDLYPNFIQVVIIQNSGYCLILDEVNFLLSIFNIFIALLFSQFMSIYTFQQNETQILLRSFFERSLIPLCYSVISIFAGLMLHNIYALYSFLASILLFDLYFGVFYYIKPHMQFLSLDVNKLIVKFSFQRISVAGFLFYFSGISLILCCIFTVPIMMKIHDSLWDERFIQFIYQTNMYFQYICIDKFRANDKMIESYFEYFAALRGFSKPYNRVLMLSLFCNHMNKCQNLKCFCQNKNFYENVKVTTQLTIDLKQIQQQVNYAVGEIEIISCYQQLLLLFIDNYVNNTKYTIIGETLIVKQSLFEINYFQNRLFQTKLKMQFLKINYPFIHPIRIQRIATSELITDNLLSFIGQNSNVQLDISSTLNYFKLIEDITIQLKIVIEEKIQIFQFIKRNYQNPSPYQLNIITQKFFSKLDSLEGQIQQAVKINGSSYIIRELQDEFYGQVKIDYSDKHKHQKTKIQFVNNNLTAFIICDFEGELLIKQYSNNLLEMINTNSQIKGSPIETIVPGILQAYHRVAVSSMIQTGETKLVNKDQYSLKVKSNKYVLEVDALLKYDYRNLNQLRFIGFMQIHDKDCMIILSDEKGKIDSASRSASNLLKLDEIDLTTLNYFQLSPNLLLEENTHEFDGFILIPKYNRQKQETLSLYRYFINKPYDCEIFLVNAKSEKTQYSSMAIYCLKINSFYQLREDDFKIIALDLMIKQFMIQKKLNKSQYLLTQESVKRIENIRKTLKINQISANQSYDDDEDYNLEVYDDSERQIQFLDQNKSNLPEFIPSLDSIRTQQEKLLITAEKCKEGYQNVQMKEKIFENYKKYDSTEIMKQEQESVRNYQNTHQVIEIELNAQEDQNIEDQLQLILQNVKKSTTRKDQLNMKNQIKNKIKASTWQGSGKQHESKKLIQNIVTQFTKSNLTYLTQIKLISCFIVFSNIGFILGFTINCIINLAGIQMDSNNQTYPLNLLQDINVIMLGIQLQDYNNNLYNLSSQFIKTGSTQYKNLSIYVNDEEHDYHTFLQELDEQTIKVRERGIQLLYKKKYFFKNYMVEKIKTIEENQNIGVFDKDAEFLFDNFPTLATELWNLKNMTTSDVIERIDELNSMSQILLIFSVTINVLLVTIFFIIFLLIIKWRNKLYSTFFLFSNLSQSITSLYESIGQLNEYQNKYKKTEDENNNKKAKLYEKFYGIMMLIILLLISLGFYVPLFIYINSVNNESIDVNQLQTEVTIMQLKQSTILNWYTINQTSAKYNKNFIHNGSEILSELIDQCSESEIFVLYELPYDTKYDFFPEIQEYASTPLCNCSLIDFQLQNGYQGFQAYVFQHLQEQQKYSEIMQAYQIVFDYQIQKKTQFDEYMQIRLKSSQQTLQVILVIIVALILLTNIFMFFLVLQRLDKLIQSAKSIVYLFPIHLIANNKYTLQLLIQSSTNN